MSQSSQEVLTQTPANSTSVPLNLKTLSMAQTLAQSLHTKMNRPSNNNNNNNNNETIQNNVTKSTGGDFSLNPAQIKQTQPKAAPNTRTVVPSPPNQAPQAQAQVTSPQRTSTPLTQQSSFVHQPQYQQQPAQPLYQPAEDKSYTIRKKVDTMRRSLEQTERSTSVSNLELYALFNDLQGMSQDLGISFQAPELVVCGMQSDGKSSLIEALLGFQFNIVETNIGTRRPLIIQMMNNQECHTPRCRFRKESPATSEAAFEEQETHVRDLSAEIIRRTNQVAGTNKNSVSDVPIILRVEYAHCANLTIYDTPGFRLGGEERLRTEIERMVMKLITPKHRIIVCLEQCATEWCNTVSRPFVQRVDPTFSRTILVNTKFDNRIKELRDKPSADGYLAGEGLPQGAQPFFVSLPVRRNLDSERYKDAIRDTYLDDYQKLLEADFDEDKYLGQVGLFVVKNHLEQVLRNEYQKALSPTLHALEEICLNTKNELAQVKEQLENQNIDVLRKKSNVFIHAFIKQIEELLHGSILGQPETNGQTLSEEKLDSGCPEWPNFDIPFRIPHSDFKLYGGAQYSRLLTEFQYVSHSREFPKTNLSEIACSLGAASNMSEGAVANLVSKKAKQILLPLVDILLQRGIYIMRHLFVVALNVLKEHTDDAEISILAEYSKFVSHLQQRYHDFLKDLFTDCSRRLKDDFVMFSSVMDWTFETQNNPNLSTIVNHNMVNNNNNNNDTTNANTGKSTHTTDSQIEAEPAPPSLSDIERTKMRVESLMQPSTERAHKKRIKLDEEGFNDLVHEASTMFASLRYVFTKFVTNKMRVFFLNPMFDKLGKFIIDSFYNLPRESYESMFFDGVEEMKALHSRLQHQLQVCEEQRDKFKEAYFKMKNY